MPGFKIYYFTYHTLADNGDTVPRKMTVIFDIPFYCSSGLNSGSTGTWFPFLGSQPDIDGWFRKPGFMKIPNLDTVPEDIVLGFPLLGDDCYKRFTTVKGMLISAALGGGLWETAVGKQLLAELQVRYAAFFENYSFTLVNTRRVLNQKIYGILNDSSKGIEWLVNINKMMQGKTGKDLSFSFSALDWVEYLNDYSKLLTPNNQPLSLELWQAKIDDYFPKVFPQPADKLSPTKYEVFHTPNQDMLKELDLTAAEYVDAIADISKEYDTELEIYKTTTDPKFLTSELHRTRTYNVAFDRILKIHFLNNGHIVVCSLSRAKILNSTDNNRIYSAYCITLGVPVIIKASSIINTSIYPSLLAASKQSGVIEIIGTTIGTLANGDKVHAIILPYYDHNLLEVLNANKLSIAAKEKIFMQLLTGLCNMHATPVLHKGARHGYVYHADIKAENILLKLRGKTLDQIPPFELQPDDFDVCIADIDTAGSYETSYHTTGYVPPELARTLLTFRHGFNASFLVEHNMAYAKAQDIWSMGILLAMLLQQEHDPKFSYSFLPRLRFILTNLGSKMQNSNLNETACLQQSKIDEEIRSIRDSLPKTTDGRKLDAMWMLVHSMLQVLPENRPTICELSNRHKMQSSRKRELSFRQRPITDFFEPKVKRQRTMEDYFARLTIR